MISSQSQSRSTPCCEGTAHCTTVDCSFGHSLKVGRRLSHMEESRTGMEDLLFFWLPLKTFAVYELELPLIFSRWEADQTPFRKWAVCPEEEGCFKSYSPDVYPAYWMHSLPTRPLLCSVAFIYRSSVPHQFQSVAVLICSTTARFKSSRTQETNNVFEGDLLFNYFISWLIN